MSAESGKAVERFDFTEDGMEQDLRGSFVLHADYAKLEQQRAALVEALEGLASAYEKLPGAQTAQGSWHSHAIAALKAAGVVL